MRTLPLLIALGLPACGPKASPDATPAGTVVLAWDLAHSTRPAVHAATIGARATKDVAYTAHPTPGSAVQLTVHVETAPIEYTEAGAAASHDAPVAVAMTVTDSGGYAIGAGSCLGPDYQLAAPGAAPRMMLMDCRFRATRPDGNVGFTVYIYGDGRVNDGTAP